MPALSAKALPGRRRQAAGCYGKYARCATAGRRYDRFRMNAGGDFLPGGNLLRVQPRRAGVAFGLRGDLRRFGDDQTELARWR